MNINIRRFVWVGGILLLAGATTCFAGTAKTPVWENAAQAYDLCYKMYNLSDWEKAASAFSQFVEKYPTSQNTPIAYVQLAHCYECLGKTEEEIAALDTVIKKFPASRIAGNVWGKKLDIVQGQDNRDQWLDIYEAFRKQYGKAPLGLSSRIDWRRTSDYWWGLNNSTFYYPPGRRTGWSIDAANTDMGWVSKVLWAADTPARALRVLDILAVTLKIFGDDLPEDWKYAHVLLLREAAKAPKEEPAKSASTPAKKSSQTKPAAKSAAVKPVKEKTYKPVAPEAAEKQFQAYLNAYPKNDPHIIGLWMREANFWSDKDPAKTDKIWIDMIEAFPGYDSLAKFATGRMNFLYDQRRYDDFVKMAQWYLKYFPLGDWRDEAIQRWINMASEKAKEGNNSQAAVVLKILDDEQKQYPLDPVRVKRNIERRIELAMATGNMKDAVKLAEGLIGKEYWSAESFAKIESLVQANKEFEPLLAQARKTYVVPETSDASPAKALYDDLQARIQDNQTRHMEELGDKLFSEHRGDAYTILGVKSLLDYYYAKAIHASRDKWVDLMANAYPLHPLTQDALTKQADALYGAKEFDRAGPVYDLAYNRFPAAGNSDHWFNRRIECYAALKDTKGQNQYAESKFGKRADGGEINAIGKLGDIIEQSLGEHKEKGNYWLPLCAKWDKKTPQGVYCYIKAYNAFYIRPTQYWHWNQVDFPAAVRVAKILRTQTLLPELAWKLNFEDINLMSQGDIGGEALKTLAERLRENPKMFRVSERLDLPNFGRAVGNAKLAARGRSIFQMIFSQCRLRSDKYNLNIMLGAMYRQAQMYPQAAKAFLDAGQLDSIRPIDAWNTHGEAAGCLREAKSAAYLTVQMKYFNQIRTAQDVSPRLLQGCVSFCKNNGSVPRAVGYLKQLRKLFPASAERGAAEQELRSK